MQQILLFVFLFLATFSSSLAQCGSPEITESPSLGSDDNSVPSKSSSSSPELDLDGSPFRRGSFIGFGTHSVLTGASRFVKASEQNNFRIGNIHHDWKDIETGGFFEIGLGLSSRRYIVVGLSLNSLALWNKTTSSFQQAPDIIPEQTTRFPPDPIPGKSFTWHFNQKARMRNYSAFAEVALFEKKGFRIFGRGDIGITKYVAKATVSYVDDCGCTQEFVKERKKELTLATNAGIGIAYNISFIGLRVLFGHQWQRPSSFYTNDDLNRWTARFDAENQDFSRKPASENFHVTTFKSKQHHTLKNNFQYLQVGLTFNIGRPH